MDEIETVYGTEISEEIKKLSIITGVSINHMADNMNIFLSNCGIKSEEAANLMSKYLDRNSVQEFDSNNWRKMHGLPMHRRGIRRQR